MLIRRALVEQHSARFDERFGRSGGEDLDFFSRLRGAKAVASSSARVFEIVPNERASAQYIRTRSNTTGRTDASKLRIDGNPSKVLRARVFAVLWIAACCPYWLTRSWSVLGFKMFAKYWYSWGVLRGLQGKNAASVLVI